MKKWFTLAGLLILIGGLMFTMTACASGWSIGGKHVEKVATVTDSFNGIDIIADTADITLLPSDDGSCKIVSYDVKKISYSTKVENGNLKIKIEDSRKWFERLFNWGKKTLTVYLPKAEYTSLTINEDTGNVTIPEGYKFGNVDISLSTGDVDIRGITSADFRVKVSTGDVSINGITCNNFTSTGSTGDISVNNLSSNGNVSIERNTGHVSVNTATISGNLYSRTSTGNNDVYNANCGGNAEINVSTGKSQLSNIKCANMKSYGDTGNLNMSNVIASGQFSIERSTGDVNFDGCDAQEIYVTTDTGHVKGTLLSAKVFQTSTDTGKIQVPEFWEGGKCKISTDTGDIIISIK